MLYYNTNNINSMPGQQLVVIYHHLDIRQWNTLVNSIKRFIINWVFYGLVSMGNT